jgi:hypothetical protein
VYVYLPRIANAANANHIRVFDGEKTSEMNIPGTRIAVLGQTNGEWISVGNYFLQKGKPAFVSIKKDSVGSGNTVADAVLLIPVK